MAGASIQVDFQDQQVQRVLAELLHRAEDLTEAFEGIGIYLSGSHDERWDDQQSPDGAPWAPLSPKYQQRKKRNRDKILVLDELLQGSLAFNASKDSVEFGTNLIYGATHQFGDDSRNIPARPFLGISEDDEAEILEILRDYLALAVD